MERAVPPIVVATRAVSLKHSMPTRLLRSELVERHRRGVMVASNRRNRPEHGHSPERRAKDISHLHIVAPCAHRHSQSERLHLICAEQV